MRPALRLSDLTGETRGTEPAARDLLVLGPSLGTGVDALWADCAALLGPGLRVVGWDLPGHGHSPAASGAFTVEELGEAVLELTAPLLTDLGEGARLLYAGVSLGGAVGLQAAITHAGAIDAVAVVCSGAVLGTPEGWRERAELVRRAGTPVMVGPSSRRWFAPGFLDARPAAASRLLWALQDADPDSYAWCCEALAGYDVRGDLGSVKAPTLVMAGEQDTVATPSDARDLARDLGSGDAVVLPGVAHQAPVEAPEAVAEALRAFFGPGGDR